MTEKRQISQGYVIRILQHFTKKLRNITNFVMLFQAVMKFLSRSKLCSLGNRAINDFLKTNKMAERYLNTNEIAVEELKAKELNEHTNKSTKFWLNIWQDWALVREYDVDIENYPILSC